MSHFWDTHHIGTFARNLNCCAGNHPGRGSRGHFSRSASSLQHGIAEDSQICKVHGLSSTALTERRAGEVPPSPPTAEEPSVARPAAAAAATTVSAAASFPPRGRVGRRIIGNIGNPNASGTRLNSPNGRTQTDCDCAKVCQTGSELEPPVFAQEYFTGREPPATHRAVDQSQQHSSTDYCVVDRPGLPPTAAR